MRILATEYSPQTRSFDIYFAGCKSPHCKGCHNPDSWDFNQGRLLDYGEFNGLLDKVRRFSDLIDRVFLLGGEPLEQDEIGMFMRRFKINAVPKELWLWTKYDLGEIPQSIKDQADFIKTGRYCEELKCDDLTMHGIKLASSNQRIYKSGVDY